MRNHLGFGNSDPALGLVEVSFGKWKNVEGWKLWFCFDFSRDMPLWARGWCVCFLFVGYIFWLMANYHWKNDETFELGHWDSNLNEMICNPNGHFCRKTTLQVLWMPVISGDLNPWIFQRTSRIQGSDHWHAKVQSYHWWAVPSSDISWSKFCVLRAKSFWCPFFRPFLFSGTMPQHVKRMDEIEVEEYPFNFILKLKTILMGILTMVYEIIP